MHLSLPELWCLEVSQKMVEVAAAARHAVRLSIGSSLGADVVPLQDCRFTSAVDIRMPESRVRPVRRRRVLTADERPDGRTQRAANHHTARRTLATCGG
jgi:hypothetical protein